MASDQLGSDLSKVERQIVASVTRMGGALREIGTTAAGFAGAQLGLQGLGAAFEAAKAGIIDFNSTMDAAQRSFTFLMGSADEARKHIAELSAVAENTPFKSDDFLQASRVLQGLGANAAAIPDVLKKIANAAVVAQVPLSVAAESIGRFLSGVSASGGANVTQGVRQLASQGLISDKLRASLTAMSETGATSQQIIEKFISSLDQFDGAADKAANSFQGLMVKIKEQAAQTAGTAFEPFFRVFEEMGRSFLAAMKDSEMQKSVQGIADIMLLAVKQIVIGMASLIDDVNTAVAAAKSVIAFLQPKIDALQKAGTIFNQAQMDAESKAIGGRSLPGGALDIPLKTDAQDRAKAIFGVAAAASEAAAKTRELAAATAEFDGLALKSGPGSIFTASGPTAEQNQKLEEARRIFESLSPNLDATGRQLLELKNRFDALSKSAGENTEKIKEWERLSLQVAEQVGRAKAIDNFIDTLEALKPGVDGVIQKLVSLGVTVKKLAAEEPEGFLRNAVHVLGQEVADSIVQFERLKGIVGDIQQKLDDMDAGAAAALQNELQINAVFKQRDDFIKDLKANLLSIAIATNASRGTGIQGIGPTIGEQTAGALENQIKQFSDWIAAAERLKLTIDPLGDDFERLQQGIAAASAAIGILAGTLQIRRTGNFAEQFTRDLDLAQKQFQVFGGDFDLFGAQITATVAQINRLLAAGAAANDEAVRALKGQLDSLQNTKRIVDFTTSSLELGMTRAADVIVDGFLRGEVAAIKWGEVVTNILGDIIKQLIKVFVIEAAIKAIQGLAGGFGSGPVQLSGPPSATGGVVFGPQVRLVGEAGPEAIIPLDKFDWGRGGGDVTVNIMTPPGTESRSEETTDAKGSRKIDIFITNVVRKGIAGGAFDREMGNVFGATRQGTRR